ncbi:hypothetical protein C1645_788493 [Glomus cerebriforme]|uniref:Uncharacterized protein n=1 Tax=Glomus cerebriforme TaxID=658196 RepID=A0A397S8S3_9GLOM|nr:hypothetical protein C1645_788493 [Glomus cerebriforme]
MLLDEEEMQEDMLLDEEEDDDKRKERKSYILNVQVKLRKRAVIKQSFNTVEPKKMFMNKNQKFNPLGDNIKLNKIYKEQDWYDRNIKMIVVYPCDSTKKREHQQTSGASKRKRAIPRVIIGTENASVLFPKDCQEWIREFKEKGPEDWDCSDIEESDDD